MRFQHTAARRRLVLQLYYDTLGIKFQHTAARRRLGLIKTELYIPPIGFNTQPPEGGWKGGYFSLFDHARFNTQPPEGGWG